VISDAISPEITDSFPVFPALALISNTPINVPGRNLSYTVFILYF
jgi:hypothetical protein